MRRLQSFRLWSARGNTCGARRIAGIVAVVAVIAAAAGCGGPKNGTFQPNHPPVVDLTAGPTARSTSSYSVPFYWTGTDVDGTVDSFLYTVDNTDTVWTGTKEHSASILFTAAHQADSTLFTTWHTLYVEAVDNSGARSQPVDITFNASTIAPFTTPERPLILKNGGGGINSPIQGGPTLHLEWTGTDPDGVFHHQPVAYDIVTIATDNNFAGNWSRAESLCTGKVAGRQPTVTRVAGDVKFYDLVNLTPANKTTNWLIWIRAVDEAGAEEPWPSATNHWPNFFLFYFAQPSLQGPLLIVNSPALGRYFAQGLGRDSTEFVFDKPITLTWDADASQYGSELDGFRWGVDVIDLDNPGDPGWASGWNRRLQGLSGLTFTDHSASLHEIVIQVRDTNGAVTTELLKLSLVEFHFDHDVLWVDDELEGQGAGSFVGPQEHHDYMVNTLKTALAALGRPAVVDTINTFPSGQQNDSHPIRLVDLSRYRVVVWDVGQPTQSCTLWGSISVGPGAPLSKANPLAVYLESGGNLLMNGGFAVRSSIRNIPPRVNSLDAGSGLAPGFNNFAYDYLHVPSKVYLGTSDVAKNGLKQALPTAWGRANGWPAIRFDTDRFFNLPNGFLRVEANDNRASRIEVGGDYFEPLYSYESAAGIGGREGSYLQGLTVATLYKRKAQTSGEDWAYQAANFGFPLSYFRAEDVTPAVTNVLWNFLRDKKWSLAMSPTPPSAASVVARGRMATP